MQIKKYFRIGEIADLLNEPTHTIRYWEMRFKIKPFRSYNHRAYSVGDLQKYLAIKTLLRIDGYTIDGAIRKLKQPFSQ